MQSAQMRVNRLTPAIIEEAAASLGLRLPEKGRQKKKKKAAAATATAPTRVRVAGMAALVLALLVVAGLWFTPVDQLIDVGLPAPPPSPVYQPRYATGPKPIPRADLLLPPPVTAPPPATPRTAAP
jgi:energy-converting hydrogenase Eha subunit A